MGLHRDEAVGGQDRGVKGKRTNNVGIGGRLIEGKSRACSENTLRQSCLKGNLDCFYNVSELQAWVVCCTSSDMIAEERASFWMDGTRCLECEDDKLGVRSRRLV